MNLAIRNEDDDLMDFLLFNAETRSSYNSAWPRLNLETMSDTQIVNNFRFQLDDLPRLQRALAIPDTMKFSERTVSSGLEALCVVLRRLAYPNRLCDLEQLFGRPKCSISVICNETIDYLHENWCHLLTEMNQKFLDQAHLQSYSDAVMACGAPLENCFGFVDGTVRPLCRPIELQREVWNGHKRCHSIKFQSLVLPNGLIANMFGPHTGRRHDCALLRESRLLEKLEGLPLDENGEPYVIYGDPAYPIRRQLVMPFKGNITQEQRNFNASMSSVRESVEWTFGKILAEFAFLDYRKDLKVFLQPVAKYYLIGALLTNCHTFLYGGIVPSYFNLSPPELEEYLDANRN